MYGMAKHSRYFDALTNLPAMRLSFRFPLLTVSRCRGSTKLDAITQKMLEVGLSYIKSIAPPLRNDYA